MFEGKNGIEKKNVFWQLTVKNFWKKQQENIQNDSRIFPGNL